MVEKGMSLKTCATQMTGLRKFYANVEEVVSLYESPFARMSEELRKKLSPTGKDTVKRALTQAEIRAVLHMLEKDRSWEGRRRYGIVLFLYSTGLRAAEFCSLSWGDVKDVDGVWIATFGHKGREAAPQEVSAETMRVAGSAYRARYNRDTRPAAPLFANKQDTRLSRQTLWSILKVIEAQALADGVITRTGIEFNPSLFRRSAAAHLQQKGVDPLSIQRFVRHKSFDSTARLLDGDRDSVLPVLAEILES